MAATQHKPEGHLVERNHEPALSRGTIIERAIASTTTATLDVWDELPASIAVEVMESVIDLLNDELAAFKGLSA